MTVKDIPRLPDNATPDQRRKWVQHMHSFHHPVLWTGSSDCPGPIEARIVTMEQEHCLVKPVGGGVVGRFKARYNDLSDWVVPFVEEREAVPSSNGHVESAPLPRMEFPGEEEVEAPVEPPKMRDPTDGVERNAPNEAMPSKATSEKGWYLIDTVNRVVWGGSNFGFRKIEKLAKTPSLKTEGRRDSSCKKLVSGKMADGKFNHLFQKQNLKIMTVMQAWEFATGGGVGVEVETVKQQRSATQDAEMVAAFTPALRDARARESNSFNRMLAIKVQINRLLADLDAEKKEYAEANSALRSLII